MALTNYLPLKKRPSHDLSAHIPDPHQRGLIALAKAGDSNAFARLYDFYADRVYDYMYFHVASEQTAEDLTARVFLKAWKNIGCYEQDRPAFGAWLYLIARNAVFEFKRQRQGGSVVMEIVSLADEGLAGYEPFRPCSERARVKG
jgi:DNA-directed RNA polymerase specialized sigma24 family protein